MEEERSALPDMKERDRVVVRTSVTGIAANVALAAMKALIGVFSGSIAVILDAVNNVSDALSSVVTIIGTKLAGRKPDAKHPYGHGRVEYFTEMVVAIIILYAGISALIESIRKIIHPEEADYTTISLILIAVAIVVKIVLGLFFRRQGKRVHSGTLEASGKDALFDAILSGSVLLSAVIFLVFHISLEAYVGVVIALFIIKAGVEMLIEMLGELLGKRVDRDVVEKVRAAALNDPAVSGVFDIVLHNYGPDRYIGSLHVEVPSSYTADMIDKLERRVAETIFKECGVAIAGVGIYSRNTEDTTEEDKIRKIVMKHDGVLQIHGFYFDEIEKEIHLDVILDFALKDREAVFQKIRSEIEEAYPGFAVIMTLDLDI